MDTAQQILSRNGITYELLVLLIPDLVGHHPHPLHAQVIGQALDIVIGLDGAAARLDDHDKLIHICCGAAAQMLKA